MKLMMYVVIQKVKHLKNYNDKKNIKNVVLFRLESKKFFISKTLIYFEITYVV
jgi:hypothetical protein